VQTDVGIAARVLRMANSAVYARRSTCRTLQDAVTTIGFRAMQDVLVAASLRSLYDSRNAVARMLWEHALAVGLGCQELAPAFGGLKAGAVFLPGLFHDVGRIAFLVSDPEAFAVIAELVDTGKHERIALEREWFGFDHAEVSAALAVDWGLAPDACDAIRWHHDPARAGGGRALAELLLLADRLANGLGLDAVVEAPSAPPQLSADVLAASWERASAAFAEQRRLFE
jgi:HD-like signal output (HDOD) protein